MNKIQVELVRLIIEKVEDTSDLENLRLVSKFLSIQATRELFSYCSVNLEDIGSEEDDDERKNVDGKEGDGAADETVSTIPQTRLERILDVPHLKQAIRTIRYITNRTPNLSIEEWNEYGHFENEFTAPRRKLVGKCNRFPKLTTVEVEFAQMCYHCDEGDERSFYAVRVPDSHEYRTAFLKKLFASLNSSQYPTPCLNTISLKNLQNVNDSSLTTSEDFLAVLKRITNLRLRVVTEYDEAFPGSSWFFPEMHNFFAELPSTWLAPCAENLKFLTIHCDQLWGYFPRCDWRGVHFPRLEKLELGNYSFSHDWQLDWIISHGKTLEVLTLDACPMLSVVRQFGNLDEENYAVQPTAGLDERKTWHYRTKWSDYYLRMQSDLPKLRVLKIGTGKWHNGENFDGAEMRLAEKSGETGVYWSFYPQNPQPAYPYTYFKRGFGPSPWFDKDDVPADGGEEETGTTNPPELDTTSQAERDQFGYDGESSSMELLS
ncbi:hypothetical protein OCU04_003386 [Sclerotinia nivalis]|uniref:F-box domain-containing protein n=1 Tax=Sclerotinia nivalis TaxID=352851 RepID=A0A9X0DLT2_9HELO|nr:hypothetical protein OCU04_003386 [Sclerotinia nivalis]